MIKAWRKAKVMIKHGVHVIPIPAGEKGCKLPNWPELASIDINQINKWEEAEPEGNYGSVCTPDTIVVLDADNPGLRSQIERMTKKSFPDTLCVRSSKGYHYYFLQTPKTREMGNRKVADMFDLQSNRKYVVGPGSLHPSGEIYTIINNTEIIPMPDWLADHLDKWSAPAKRVGGDSTPDLHEDFDPDDWYDFNDISGYEDGDYYIPDECPVSGTKHAQSQKTGFFYDGETWGWHDFATGCEGSEMTIGQVVAFINNQRREKGKPVWTKPIWVEDDSDLDGVEMLEDIDLDLLEPRKSNNPGTVASGDVTKLAPISERLASAPEPEEDDPEPDEDDEQEERKPTDTTLKSIGKSDGNLMVVQCAADIPMEELEWMWNQKIPKGKVTFFTGKPDCCKSLCLIDLIARASTGRDYADGQKNEDGPVKVLLGATEDDAKDTLIPRLVAAGADLKNVMLMYGTVIKDKKSGKNKKRNFNLREDATLLVETIAANPDIRLLALDPFSSFFGDADQNKDKDIRPMMDKLKETCEKSKLTVVAILHSNKRSDVDAMDKVAGARSLGASVRAVWGFSRDTDNKDLLHMANVKGNLAKEKSGLDYSIKEVMVTLPNGKLVGAPQVAWGDKFDGDADDLLAAGRDKKDKSDYKVTLAKAFLKTLHYPIKSTVLYEKAKQDEGLTKDNLLRAKEKLMDEGFHIVSRKRGDVWSWYKMTDDGKYVNDTSQVMTSIIGVEDVV